MVKTRRNCGRSHNSKQKTKNSVFLHCSSLDTIQSKQPKNTEISLELEEMRSTSTTRGLFMGASIAFVFIYYSFMANKIICFIHVFVSGTVFARIYYKANKWIESKQSKIMDLRQKFPMMANCIWLGLYCLVDSYCCYRLLRTYCANSNDRDARVGNCIATAMHRNRTEMIYRWKNANA